MYNWYSTWQISCDLKNSGFTDLQAEAVVSALKATQESHPTKFDMQIDLANLETRLVLRLGILIVILESLVVGLIIRQMV